MGGEEVQPNVWKMIKAFNSLKTIEEADLWTRITRTTRI